MWKFEPSFKKRDYFFCLAQKSNPVVVLFVEQADIATFEQKELYLRHLSLIFCRGSVLTRKRDWAHLSIFAM